MPVLFFFRALRLFLTGNDQLVVVQADLDIFLVHTGAFGGHFECIVCFRHTNCRRASPNGGPSPNVGRRRNSDRKHETRLPFRAAWLGTRPVSALGSWSTISEDSSVHSVAG